MKQHSNLNNKTQTNSLSSKPTNKLKIAHRTRSKCPIGNKIFFNQDLFSKNLLCILTLGERSLNEIESQLPDDLLFENNNIDSVIDGKLIFSLYKFKKFFKTNN